MGGANITLYAQWAVAVYTIGFNSNGGSAVDSLRVASDTTAAPPPPPTRMGFTFAGWFTDQALTNPFAFTVPITAATTLYAKWTAVYTLTYNANGNTGGGVPVDSIAYAQGATVTVKGNTGNLSKAGYSYVGWNTAADGSGIFYPGGVTFAMGASHDTLYARWTRDPTYSVLYNGNGNTGGAVPVDSADSTAYVQGSTVTVKENTGNLSRMGYTFVG